ncbi:MAG TPA: tail fiber domain-containing protein [Clostridiales bacterium]|nr:tail fiber domain-containing protein [Clostridiales bacterium]HQP69901.1 tail fiber domain-containing protein [Clostridiales bacterium]
MLKKYAIWLTLMILIFSTNVMAVTLFEIKDEAGNPVLVVSSDGLRILNGADTLMVISSTAIKAYIDESKALPRTFSVSTSTGSASSVLDVTTDGMRIYDQSLASKALGDTLMTISSRTIKAHIASGSKGLSRSFCISTASSKGSADIFNISTDSTKIGTGSTTMGQSGDLYTNFSPENILLGLNAGQAITSCSGNTIMGNYAGMSNQGGPNNVMIGESAGRLFNGTYGNVFIGEGAADSLTDGHRNIMIGFKAGASPSNTQVSYGNIFLGAVAGLRVNGDYNIMIGEAAGENYLLESDGGYNVFLGKDAGRFNTGDNNICIGVGAGSNEYNDPITGNHNIFIGDGADATLTTDSYRLAIGGAYGDLLYGRLDTPKQLVVDGNLDDNTNSRKFFVNGSAGGTTAWYNDSDERFKKNILTIDGALDKVMKLRGVTYEWKDPEKHEKGRKMGFIAQESKDIIPEAVDYNAESDRYTMQYSTITAVLVEAVKDLKKQADANVAALESKESENKKTIDVQNEKIGILIKENIELKNKVSELENLRTEIEKIKNQLSGFSSR